MLEVYALRAALGSLALRKLLLEGAVPVDELERALARLRKAVEGGRAQRAADADLAYQSLIITSSGLPRVADEFERLTWQVRGFIVALELTMVDKLPRILAEMEVLHAALVAGTRRGGRMARKVRALGAPAGRAPARALRRALWTALVSGGKR